RRLPPGGDMKSVILALAVLAADEAVLRETFSKDIKAKDASARVAAVRKLSGAKETKTVGLLVASLKDPSLEGRKAAAETLEKASDGAGVAVNPLGEILSDKKEDIDLKIACAKALAASPYKSETFPHFYKTISTIEPEDKHLHKFGFNVTQILD